MLPLASNAVKTVPSGVVTELTEAMIPPLATSAIPSITQTASPAKHLFFISYFSFTVMPSESPPPNAGFTGAEFYPRPSGNLG